MTTLITVIHIITCALIVLVVLMQSGKGAEISASFGGSSQTVFGSSGGANFFTKLTFGLAAVFMTTSLVLTVVGSKSAKKSVFDAMPTTTQSAPVNPAAGGAPAAAAPEAAKAPAAQAPATSTEQKK